VNLRSRRRSPAPVPTALTVLLLTAVAAGVSACGSSSNSSAAATAAAPSVFKIGQAEQFNSLDPDLAEQNDALEVINQFGGTLTRFTPDASRVVPGLAKSWTVSDDGKTYTFSLRPGLKFSTGAPLTASDVVASWNRYMTDKHNVNIGLFADVSKLTAPSAQTVVIHLKGSDPSFLQVIAEPNFIVSPGADLKDPAKFYLHPISDGPYEVQSFSSSGHGATLVRNPHYYGPKPAVKELQFEYVSDANTRLIELKSGQLDLAQDITPDTASQLTGSTKPVNTTLYGGWYLYVNIRHPPLSNVNVRKAISLAIDRGQLINTVWNGSPKPLYGFFPTSMPPWHENTLPIGPNVKQAKALLAGTPCAHGCTINLLVRSDASYYADMASIIQQNLAAIGIKLNLQQADASTAGTDEENGAFQLAVGGLTDYTNVPDGFLEYGLLSNGGIDALFSGYDSARMDGLIKTVLSVSGQKRLDAMNQINSLYAQDVPSIPLLDWDWINGERSSLTHWVTPTPSFFVYATASTGS
jgi:peptide/nickel transport system substrate-binding protein